MGALFSQVDAAAIPTHCHWHSTIIFICQVDALQALVLTVATCTALFAWDDAIGKPLWPQLLQMGFC